MPSTIYKKWRSSIHEGPVDLTDLQQDLKELEDSVSRGEAELQERRAALDEAKADLDALQDLRAFLAHGAMPVPLNPGVASSSASLKLSVGRRWGSKREAILSILADGQALHTTAIRKLLVDAEEIGSDQASYHALQVTLSQLYRAEELERPARGVYAIKDSSPAEGP